MNPVDIALIVLLALATLRGLWRGLIRESFGLLALVGGLLAALKLSGTVSALIGAGTGLPPATVAAIAFVGIFAIVDGVVTLLGFGLDRITGASVRVFSRLAGAAFGLLKAGTVLAFVLLFFDLFPLAPEIKTHMKDSHLARPLVSLAETIVKIGTHRAGQHA